MCKGKLKEATEQALRGHTRIFGVYLLSAGDIARLIAIVLRIMGTLSTDECKKCISELISDVKDSQ